LETSIFTKYSPNLSVEIVIRFQSAYDGLSLSQKSILLGSGQNLAYFFVNCILLSTTTRGAITLSLDGINADVYTLSTKLL